MKDSLGTGARNRIVMVPASKDCTQDPYPAGFTRHVHNSQYESWSSTVLQGWHRIFFYKVFEASCGCS